MVLPISLLSFFFPLVSGLPTGADKSALESKDNAANTSIPLRILPLGDSITWGWQPAYQQDGTNGYRQQLLTDLFGAGYGDVQFVGTQHSGLMIDDLTEGHPGYTITQIHSVMNPGLVFKPNIVLLHAGTNDLNRPQLANESWADAPKRLTSLIEDIYTALPDTLVIVAQIIQAQNNQTEANLEVFNRRIPGVVSSLVQEGHKATYVDQSVVTPDELVDGLHPTDEGYAHMGTVWYQGVMDAADNNLITWPPM